MKKQAFTLVELIVAIAILTILGIIAFISLQGYSKISRDSVRVRDLSTVKTVLELYELEAGKFPEPSNGVNITYSGSIVWIQGTYGESTGINVDKMGKIPIDPLTEKEYTYSVTFSRKEYNLGGILEGDEVVMNNFLSEVNAGETTVNALVTGTYNGHMLKTLSGSLCSVLAIPSIIINDTSTSTDLLEIVNNQKLVYNGYKNLPSSFIGSKFKIDGGFAYIPNKLVVYNDSIGCSSLSHSETERILLLKNLQENYSGTILGENENFKEFMNTDIDLFNPNNSSKLISRELISNNLNLRLNEKSLTFLNCEGGIIEGYTYGNVSHGQGESVTKVLSTPNGIKNYGALATCNNGNIQIVDENINITCDSGYVEEAGLCVQNICNGEIPSNGHSTATSQNITTLWTNNSTPGLCTFECDENYVWNGSICMLDTQNTNCTSLPTNAVWNITDNITQTWNGTSRLPTEIGSYDINESTTTCNFICDTNYTWNTTICEADTQSTTCGGTVPTNATATTPTTYTQTRNGTDWTPTTSWGEFQATCDFDCNAGYTWNGTTCTINTYTVSGSFGTNANGATINVCGTNVTADTSGNFTATRNHGSTCNTITATRTNYTCSTTTNGPVSLTANTTNIVGSCIENTQTFTCAAKPAVGTLWNTVSDYQQTWNGTAWLPADTATAYNITPSTTSCNYICDTGYFWNSSICESQWSGDAATGYLFKNTSGIAQYPLSCNDLLDNSLFQNTLTGSPWNGTKFNDGVYWIKPTTTSPYKAYCNMTTDGGGWTMVLAQYEADPVTNWNEGIQGDYDPTLATKKGFTLNTSQLPEHNQIGLGKDFDSTFVDYVNGIYTTGNLPVTLLKSPKTNYGYQIHRNLTNYYGGHNPEGTIYTIQDLWSNTLTIDKTGGTLYTWAFSPNQTLITSRTYSLKGVDYQTTSEAYAWTIWVRKSPGIFLVGDNGGFHWNNGTYESNCKGYIDNSNYNDEGSGVYWIKPDTNPAFKVYCDMTNNEGGWTLLSNQTSYDGTNVYGANACNSLTGNCGGNLQKLGHTTNRFNKIMIRHANGKYVVFDLKSGGNFEKMFMGQAVYSANYEYVYIYEDNIHNRSGYSDILGFRGPNSSNDSMWLSNYSYSSSNWYTYAFKWASNCASIGYSNGVATCLNTGGFSIFVKTDNEILGTEDKPGKSCKEILISGDSNGDGVYWIKPDANPAFQVYCDMTTDGGGWTLVRKMQSTSIVTGNTSASNAASLVNLSTASANVSDVTWNSLKPLQVWNICNGSQTIYNRNMGVPWYSNHGVADSCGYNRGFWTSMQKNFGATHDTGFTYQACGGGLSTTYGAWGVITGIYDSSAYYGCYDLYSTNTTSPAPAKFDNRSGTAIGWGGNGYVLVR